MIIPFAKITKNGVPFEFKKDGINFHGSLARKSLNLVKCDSIIEGKLNHTCDRCGSEIVIDLNEECYITLSDGIFKDSENELSDTIEFFDGNINIEDIYQSELEAFKSGYFYCDNCKNL